MKKFVVTTLIFLFANSVWAQEKLIMIGGGKYPPAALTQFAQWANPKSGRMLVFAWASGSPEDAFQSFKARITKDFSGIVEGSLVPPATSQEKDELIGKINTATAIFFTGGSQIRIMRGFEGDYGTELLDLLKQKYAEGIPVAGTSAGTAIMSRVMIAGGMGPGDLSIAEGLGFAHSEDREYIVDQHFSQRKREERLFAAMKSEGIKLGLGVDEDTAAIVENRRDLAVVGPFRVRAFLSFQGQTSETSLVSGEKFDLQTWRTTSRNQIAR